MRVLHVLQSNRFSGAENVVCQIITSMRADSDIDFIYCSRDGQIREALAERNITFAPLKEISRDEIKRVIDEVKPDVIHAHDRSASMVAALATKKIPIIAHMHVNNNRGISLMVKNFLWTLVSKRFKHIFWVSNTSFNGFQFHSLLKKKSSVLYNVMDRKSTIEKATMGKSDDIYDVVYVGRLSYQKHPERLMSVLSEICKRKSDFRAAVIGDGEYADYVKNYIADNNLGEQIKYLGYLNKPLGVIQNSKVLLMTSRFEGTPMVAIEAQILGTPIVSTPADGMCEIITNDVNGYLSNFDEELVESTMRIITDKQLHARLQKGCEEESKKFTDIEKFCDLIKDKYISYQER